MGRMSRLKLEELDKKLVSEEDSSIEIVMMESELKAMEKALSIFLILKKILGYLPDSDLQNCVYVCQLWRIVADSMLIHFDVKWEDGKLFETKCTRGRGDPQFEYQTLAVREQMKYLRKQKQSYYMDLTINEWFLHYHTLYTDTFFLRYGPRVRKLTYKHEQNYSGYADARCYRKGVPIPPKSFFNLITRYFTRLEALYLLNLVFTQANNNDVALKGMNFQKLEFLQKIDFGQFMLMSEDVGSVFLDIMPNIKEMYNVPASMIPVLEARNKIDRIRSVVFNPSSEGFREGVEVLRTLKRMNIKLLCDNFGRLVVE